jgi:hypothetical protein
MKSLENHDVNASVKRGFFCTIKDQKPAKPQRMLDETGFTNILKRFWVEPTKYLHKSLINSF